MDQQEGVQWFMKQYGISEQEANDSYKATVDFANFCITEYYKSLEGGGILNDIRADKEESQAVLNYTKALYLKQNP